MKSAKIKTLRELKSIVTKQKAEGKKVGLITGCFDIIHAGHIKLFKLAKESVDVLLVGLENDSNVTLAKGINRPIYKYSERETVLSALEHIDYVFPIKKRFKPWENLDTYYRRIYRIILPTHLITSPSVDKYWINKEDSAKKLGMDLVKIKRYPKSSSSSTVARLIEKDG